MSQLKKIVKANERPEEASENLLVSLITESLMTRN